MSRPRLALGLGRLGRVALVALSALLLAFAAAASTTSASATTPAPTKRPTLSAETCNALYRRKCLPRCAQLPPRARDACFCKCFAALGELPGCSRKTCSPTVAPTARPTPTCDELVATQCEPKCADEPTDEAKARCLCACKNRFDGVCPKCTGSPTPKPTPRPTMSCDELVEKKCQPCLSIEDETQRAQCVCKCKNEFANLFGASGCPRCTASPTPRPTSRCQDLANDLCSCENEPDAESRAKCQCRCSLANADAFKLKDCPVCRTSAPTSPTLAPTKNCVQLTLEECPSCANAATVAERAKCSCDCRATHPGLAAKCGVCSDTKAPTVPGVAGGR